MDKVNTVELDALAEENKRNMLSLMNDMESLSASGGGPKPDESFFAAKRMLQKTAFNVVVCGEIKQGKSSFVNSLVGRNILPTAVDVATCQTCMISDSDDGTTECSLVFEDGERSKIDETQVGYYGKERGVNLLRDPLVEGRALSHIEIKLPVKFLPKGVNIVDTPGLGALNPQHSVIAERWIAVADAVVFVSDISRPLTRFEIDELVRIYKKTPNVLIVQTKTDMLSGDKLGLIVNDNKMKISEALTAVGLRRDIVVIPFSALLLTESGKEKDADNAAILLRESRTAAVLSALHHLFLQTVCYYALIVAYQQSSAYYKILLKEVEKRNTELKSSGEERKKLKAEAERKIGDFNSTWGKNGAKVREVAGFVSKMGNMVQQRLSFFIGGGIQSAIYVEFCKSIDTLDNSEQISDYQENLHYWVHAAICKLLNDINQAIVLEYNKQLSEFAGQIKEEDIATPQTEEDFEDITLPRLSLYEKARNVMFGFRTGWFVAKIIDVVAYILAPMTAGGSLILLAIAEGIVIGVGAYRGVKVSANTALGRQRVALKKVALDDIVRHWNELRQPKGFGGQSKLEQWIFDSAKRFNDDLSIVIAEKRQSLQENLDRIKKLDSDLFAAQKEMMKFIAIAGSVRPDGTCSGLLAVKGRMKSIRSFIAAKAGEMRE